MNLQDQLDHKKDEVLAQLSDDVKEKMTNFAFKLGQSGIVEKSLGLGQKIPPFSLPNVSGKPVNIQDLLNQGPVVLSFYRGAWCPYCNLELQALKRVNSKIESLGAQLVAISPQIPDQSLSLQEKLSLPFEVLSDVGNIVARSFGLVFRLGEELRPIYKEFGINIPAYNGDDKWELPIPATYVIKPDGTIILDFVNSDYTKRLNPEDILSALKVIQVA
ncbi:alkyl hydroperoxide reductase [bacterium F11]|nr:alkyl hydroperoxide reductase [bacterium F11]